LRVLLKGVRCMANDMDFRSLAPSYLRKIVNRHGELSCPLEIIRCNRKNQRLVGRDDDRGWGITGKILHLRRVKIYHLSDEFRFIYWLGYLTGNRDKFCPVGIGKGGIAIKPVYLIRGQPPAFKFGLITIAAFVTIFITCEKFAIIKPTNSGLVRA